MSDLLTMTPTQFCDAIDACSDGREYALTQPTMADVWDNCLRPDWLLWIAEKLGHLPDNRTLRIFVVWCARSTPLGDGRTTGDLLTDPRSLAALKVTERYADLRATEEELTAAQDAAGAAAGGAARYAARAAQADRLRTLVPNPFRKEAQP
jgi:hypothetical protein